MNSLMSKRRNSTPSAAASCFATSVLPTPVGPAKRKEPTGFSGWPSPARARRIAETTVSMAWSCPKTRSLMSRSRVWRRSRSETAPVRGAGLVDHVDRLVGEEAVVHVLGGQLGGRAERAVGVGDAVVLLVVRLEAAQDGVGVLDARLRHLDLLEAAGQRAVALEVALVVLVGGRADAAQLARGERGLQDVGGVHRAALRRARADHGVDLVDEEDGARLRLERADDGLQPRLELAAELRAGEERSHVERVDADVLQDRGHRAAVDAEREALDDGRLAHARVAHEDGVVLPPPAEHVDGALELALAADERIDAARGRLRDQVDGEGAERIARRAGALLVVLLLFLARRAGRLGLGHLRNTMRDVADHIEARDALLGEEVGGVRLGLAEDGDQDIAPVELHLAWYCEGARGR